MAPAWALQPGGRFDVVWPIGRPVFLPAGKIRKGAALRTDIGADGHPGQRQARKEDENGWIETGIWKYFTVCGFGAADGQRECGDCAAEAAFD